jgi:hypothetical protein
MRLWFVAQNHVVPRPDDPFSLRKYQTSLQRATGNVILSVSSEMQQLSEESLRIVR